MTGGIRLALDMTTVRDAAQMGLGNLIADRGTVETVIDVCCAAGTLSQEPPCRGAWYFAGMRQGGVDNFRVERSRETPCSSSMVQSAASQYGSLSLHCHVQSLRHANDLVGCA